MIYLLLLFFITWCLIRVVKDPSTINVILIIAMILAVLLVFGMPHFYKAAT